MGNAAIERIQVLKPGQTFEGKQGFVDGSGASAETVGSERICMNVVPMPPGAKAKVHYHDKIETIACLLDGSCAVYCGDQMEHRSLLYTGDQIVILADVPHAPCNERDASRTWIVVHSSASDQDGIVMPPELDRALEEKSSPA
ncbi:MAG: cupin domain-containing protein [Pseudomonadota bacterium]